LSSADGSSRVINHPGHAFTCAELMEKVWGSSSGDVSTVIVSVRRLREKGCR
jgi:DNA-binding response OmpR family regulator